LKTLRRFFLYLILFVILLLGILYVSVNSSYVFDKVARYFAPQYEIHYDKISGNAWTGITIEGLYYKEKKLARQIEIALNPATLLEKKITVSHLTLHGVNEQYLEMMIADLSSDEEDNSSNSFPFSIRLNDVKLSMLPFSVSGIRFVQADLRVESIDYAEDNFSFGTLKLLAKTSLGRADMKGHYQGRDLQLSDLYIGNLNTEEIERRLQDDHSSQGTEDNKTAEESPSIFIPKTMSIQRLKVTALPRNYHGISLSLLNIDGTDVGVDLEHETAKGALKLFLRTDVAKADIDLLASADHMQFRKISVDDINLTKLLTALSSEDNRSQSMPETGREQNKTADIHIPFVPDQLGVDTLSATFLPAAKDGISISQAHLKVKKFKLVLSQMLVKEGEVLLDAESPIASLRHQGSIKNNQLGSHIEILPKEALFSRYHLPLRRGAFKKLALDAVTDTNGVSASMAFAAPRLLAGEKGTFNIDLNASQLHLHYPFTTGELTGDLASNISTPYTKKTLLHLHFEQKDQLSLKGEAHTASIDGIDSKFAALLENLTVHFDGDLNNMLATIGSNKIQGHIRLKNFSKGEAHFETKKTLALRALFKLPEALKESRAKLLIDIPIDTNKILPLHAKAKLLSNVLNADANVSYDKVLSLQATTTVPPQSLLRKLDKNIQFSALSPAQIIATLHGDDLRIQLDAKKLKLMADRNLKSGVTKGDINLAGSHLKISAASTEALSLRVKSDSIQTLLSAVKNTYKVDLPDINGDIALQAEIKNLASLALTLRSKGIKLGKGKKATQISNLVLKAAGDTKGIVLERYTLETQGLKLFATKPSKVLLDGDNIRLSSLWLNDRLKATGTYHLKQKKGKITAQATALKIDHKMAEIVAALGIDTQINGNKISVSGKVHLQGGTIKYDLNTKSFAADSDIIILQRQRKKNNTFEKNVAMALTMDSSKPLLYKKGAIDIALLPNLTIKKRYGDSIHVDGKISLLPGGSYRFEGKKFVLKKSSIVFRGKPTAPILNINILYRHEGTTIRVKVSGTASDPSLHFSSDPHMSREEILSFIMFDTESGGGENKAGDVTNLVAGSLVKSLFSSMGLKLDHLVLTGAGFEVGKKLSDRITVIYDQQKESTVKLRIQNTKHIETDISFGASSRSADIFYKKEF